jgi:RTX calcium-binding nonapeptide repeat (4 copies)
MTPFVLSDQPNASNAGDQSTQYLVNKAITDGHGTNNINYLNAYNAIYNDLVAQNANGNTIDSGVLAWFQLAGGVNTEQWSPTAQGTFIWDYTAVAAYTESGGDVTLTNANLQDASNAIALNVFQTLAATSNNFNFDSNAGGNFSMLNIVANDAGAGIQNLQNDYPTANLDTAIWGGTLFARTQLLDASYFDDYNIKLGLGSRDSVAILAGLFAGADGTLFYSTETAINGVENIPYLDVNAIKACLTPDVASLVLPAWLAAPTWTFGAASAPSAFTNGVSSGNIEIYDATSGQAFSLTGAVDSSNAGIAVVYTPGAGFDVIHYASSGSLASTTYSYDASGKLTLTTENAADGYSVAFQPQTSSGLAYNSSTSMFDATLATPNNTPVATVALDVATDTGTVTLGAGPLATGLQYAFNDHSDPVMNDPIATPEEVLIDYLSDLGISKTAAQLAADNDAFLNPSETPVTVTGSIDTSSVAEEIVGSPATDVFFSDTNNAVITGTTATVTIDGTDYVPTNVLFAIGDMTQDTLSNIQALVADEDLPNNNLTLTAAQFNSFDIISDGAGGFPVTLTIADGGTVSLQSASVVPNPEYGESVAPFNLVASGWEGTTLIGDNRNLESLTASEFGDDTLTAGNGTGDTLTAGEGVDTLTGGTGGDTFIADSGLAAGSVIEGAGTGNALEASGDISGATISGVQELDTGDDVTLTVAELGDFSTIDGTFAVSDTATNVMANITALEALVTGSQLTAITLTDSSTPTISLTATQLAADSAALHVITTVYDLSISDTAANVVSNITALESFATGPQSLAITLTDSGTPTLSLTAAQLAANSAALGMIGSAYNLSVSGVTAANATTVAAQANVTALTVSDTAANVAADLEALETLASGSQLTSITLTDGSTPTISLTATQLADDSDALGVIGSAYNLSVSGVTAANAATVAGNTHVTLLSVSDTAANVVSNIAALETLATGAQSLSITLTDSGTPTLALTAAQVSANSAALGVIGSAYNVSVADTAANVVSNIAALETFAAHLSSITLTDSGTPTLTLTAAQLTADSAVLPLITSAYNLSMTAGNVTGDTLSVAGTIGNSSLTVDDILANNPGSDYNNIVDADHSTGNNTLAVVDGSYDLVRTDYSTGTNSLAAGNGSHDYLDADNSKGSNNLTEGDGANDTMSDVSSSGGNTLIAGNGNSDYLNAESSTGANTLTVGNGTDDAVSAGTGVDAITTGTGAGDTVYAYNGLAAGSSVTADNTSSSTLVADGDIFGATISGVHTLSSTTEVTLNATQFANFSSFAANISMDASGGGTFALAGKGGGGDTLTATATTGTTLTVGGTAGQTLVASATGADTLTAGGGNGDVVKADNTSGNDILSVGAGTSDVLSAVNSTGNVSLTAGSGAGDELTAAGSTGTDTLKAGSANDTLIAGTGNDTLEGGNGYDTYQFGASFGSDAIRNIFTGTRTTADGEVDFTDSGTTDEKLWFQRSGNNLLVDFIGTANQITLNNWYSNNAAQVESFHADGLTLDTQIATMVSAMASYASANPGFNPQTATAMPTDTTLQSAITASWHS